MKELSRKRVNPQPRSQQSKRVKKQPVVQIQEELAERDCSSKIVKFQEVEELVVKKKKQVVRSITKNVVQIQDSRKLEEKDFSGARAVMQFPGEGKDFLLYTPLIPLVDLQNTFLSQLALVTSQKNGSVTKKCNKALDDLYGYFTFHPQGQLKGFRERWNCKWNAFLLKDANYPTVCLYFRVAYFSFWVLIRTGGCCHWMNSSLITV